MLGGVIRNEQWPSSKDLFNRLRLALWVRRSIFYREENKGCNGFSAFLLLSPPGSISFGEPLLGDEGPYGFGSAVDPNIGRW